jgi:hypothetical protein
MNHADRGEISMPTNSSFAGIKILSPAAVVLAAVAACLSIGGCGQMYPSEAQQTASLGSNGIGNIPSGTLSAIVNGTGRLVDEKDMRLVQPASSQPADLSKLPDASGSDYNPMASGDVLTAIDPRGYYLTATSNLGSGAMWVVSQAGPKAVRPARVVFKGDANFKLAIVCVGGPIPDAFKWSDDSHASINSVLIGSGPVMTDTAGKRTAELFAGKVLSDAKANGDGCNYDLLTSSLPCRPADGGGPVLTSDGALVAITTKPAMFKEQAVCIRPDPAWVKQTIDRDYAMWAGQ